MKKRLIRLVSVTLILFSIFSIASSGVFAATSKPILKEGMRSSAVKTLQTNLKKLGFFSAAPTGYYGDATVSAVKKFQKKYKIPTTGVVSTLTYNKLDALLKPAAAKKTPAKTTPVKSTAAKKPAGLKAGSSGKEVLQLQKDLVRLGYMKVSPTGQFGSITEGALTQFQKYYGLDPNGIASSGTLSVISRLLGKEDSSRGDVDREDASEAAGPGADAKVSVVPLYKVGKQWIPGIPQTPFLQGVGKYEGVVLHFTANMTDTAQTEADHEKIHWRKAFVHEFIDPREIIQVSNPEYKAWGAGEKANDRFIHLELCHADTRSDFDASFSMITQRAAEYLYGRQLGVTPAKADGSGTLWAHADVSKYLGDTNHVDPIAYLASWGVSWNDVIRIVTEKYNALASGKTPDTKTDAAPAAPAGTTPTLNPPAENAPVENPPAENPPAENAPVGNTGTDNGATEGVNSPADSTSTGTATNGTSTDGTATSGTATDSTTTPNTNP
jgi:peptidoglycan hydrolase-like protein with peptidoglycan-binding domain